MSKYKRHYKNQASFDGAREGMIPLHKSVIPGVGFLAGKAVLYKRAPDRGLLIYERTAWNMFIIFLKINQYLVKKKAGDISFFFREKRDDLIIAFRTVKEKIRAYYQK